MINVRCPACSTEAWIHPEYPNGPKPLCGNYNCQQPLDPVIHELHAMDDRVRISMQTFPAERLRAFLVSLANTGGRVGIPPNERSDRDAAEYFVKRFRDLFPPPFPANCLLAANLEAPPDQRRGYSLDGLLGLRNRLRFAWCCSEVDRREWRILGCRKDAWLLTAHPSITRVVAAKILSDEPPPNDGLQQAFRYFLRNGHSARCCAYQACTQDKFFFAENPNQRYCSSLCSARALRDSKNAWWAEHGTEWRENRSERKAGNRRPKQRRGKQ
jgi:hypothetical protein